MSARDEPTYLAAARIGVNSGERLSPTIGRALLERIDRDAKALKAAQLRTITTEDELEALPAWSIVEANGVCFVNSREGYVCWEGMSAGFGSSSKHLIRVHGSVTVLFTPEAQS